ncbi:hypothetical protein [Sulfuriroseicoccus oceanibius]|uniref:Uncharacterized protein n=1 Tax=Sulfuriroseicoccus oceanibius TaxID=2707525 RepID=A0A6B3L2B3_9BACT|nr:hypothetical protein [Sulfuriroseicoccus oceanibius]QQL43843.1 hypothetical protein G3M56_008020 [Sulfuriroseicoccus oceanibius]
MKQDMRIITSVLAVVATLALNTDLIAGEINSDQLAEGFISFVAKVEKSDADAKTVEKMRQELKRAHKNPLLVPYKFEGKKCDRVELVKTIEAGIRKWKASDIPLSKSASFASDSKNLQSLSDAELIVAKRLVEQVVTQIERIK